MADPTRCPRNAGEIAEVAMGLAVVGQMPFPDPSWYLFRWDHISGSWVTDTSRHLFPTREAAEEVLRAAVELAPLVDASDLQEAM